MPRAIKPGLRLDSRRLKGGHRDRTSGPIVEAMKWIAVTGKLEFVNDWEKTPSGGVLSFDWQLTPGPMT